MLTKNIYHPRNRARHQSGNAQYQDELIAGHGITKSSGGSNGVVYAA